MNLDGTTSKAGNYSHTLIKLVPEANSRGAKYAAGNLS